MAAGGSLSNEPKFPCPETCCNTAWLPCERACVGDSTYAENSKLVVTHVMARVACWQHGIAAALPLSRPQGS